MLKVGHFYSASCVDISGRRGLGSGPIVGIVIVIFLISLAIIVIVALVRLRRQHRRYMSSIQKQTRSLRVKTHAYPCNLPPVQSATVLWLGGRRGSHTTESLQSPTFAPQQTGPNIFRVPLLHQSRSFIGGGGGGPPVEIFLLQSLFAGWGVRSVHITCPKRNTPWICRFRTDTTNCVRVLLHFRPSDFLPKLPSFKSSFKRFNRFKMRNEEMNGFDVGPSIGYNDPTTMSDVAEGFDNPMYAEPGEAVSETSKAHKSAVSHVTFKELNVCSSILPIKFVSKDSDRGCVPMILVRRVPPSR